MNSSPQATAQEINRLHEEVIRGEADSKNALHAALVAAWKAGQLLRSEKKRVTKSMGRGAWTLWLEQNFKGSDRTAQKYMRLAETVTNLPALKGMSLRSVYLRLGIATEKKSRADALRLTPLPAHIRLANKLLVTLKHQPNDKSAEQVAIFQRDLRALYDQLRLFFEDTSATFTRSPFPPKSSP